MAVATGLTKERMLQIEAASVVQGSVNANGDLTLVTHDGTAIPAGNVKGPKGDTGAGYLIPTRWWASGSYAKGQVVGYGGVHYEAIGNAPTVGKPPPLNGADWRPLTGRDPNAWAGSDWDFDSGSLDGWTTFWKGGTSTVSFTKTAGEIDTGYQSLKVSLSADGNQRLYPWDENIVRGGEVITAQVRAKVLSGAATIDAPGMQAIDGVPEPFAATCVWCPSIEGNTPLTNSWATYTFTVPTVNALPRMKMSVFVDAVDASGPAVVVIEWIKFSRSTSGPLAAYPVGSIFKTTDSKNPKELLGGGVWERYAKGQTIVGVDEAQTEFDTVGETGGEKTHTLSVNEMPSHNHGGATGGQSATHTHNQVVTANTGGTGVRRDWQADATGLGRYAQGVASDGANSDHSHGITPQGGGAAFNVLQPYVVTYVWRRTA